MAGHDLRDLIGIHEHPADLRRLVGAARDARDPRAGSSAWTRVVAQHDEVRIREPEQRPVRVGHRGDDFARFARRDRRARLGVEYLDDLIGMQVHTHCRPALVRGVQAVGGAVDLAHHRAGAFLKLCAKLLGQFFCRDERDFERPVLGRINAGLDGLVAQQLQERRRADVPGHGELREDLDLDLGVLRAGRHDGTAHRDQLILQTEAAGREVVAERVEDDVVLAEAHRMERVCERRLPAHRRRVVAPLRRVEVGAGRDEDALRFVQGERAEARACSHRLFLHRDRDAREVVDVADVVRLQAGLLELAAIEVRRLPADFDGLAQ